MGQLKHQMLRLVFHAALAVCINAWSPSSLPIRLPLLRKQSILSVSTSNKEDIVDSDEDWREFRAQLVRSENDNNIDSPSKKLKTPDREKEDDDGHWAYETGEFVERGSIVISVPSSDAYLNDVDILNNICYRKSIVLVLDVSPNFIQGIVLNRPTNIGVREGMRFVQPGHNEMFENEMGDCLGENCELDFDNNDDEKQKQSSGSARWKVWFGGEVGGPFSEYPQVMCIHSIKTESALDVSDKVLPGIYVTSFSGAQDIVRAGDATPSDFWLFAGIFGVETSTFYSEMQNEGLWHILSADSGTVLEELNMLRCEEMEELDMEENCDIDADPRNAGLHTWEMLMQKIGLEKEAHESEDSFGDLMLREWATGALSFSVNEEQTTSMIMDPSSMLDDDEFDLAEYDPASAMFSKDEDALSNQPQSAGIVGVMVRASSAKRSPYLLSDQGFHKSLVLIVHDGDDFSEGIILNHVTSRSLQLDLGDKVVDLPLRYGGPAAYYSEYDEDDEDENEDYELPTVFLHSSESLKEAGVGVPVGKSRIYKCTEEEVINVLKLNMATVDDFMAVQGSSMWTKRGEHTGIIGDVEAGFFELVPRPNVHDVFTTLQKQEILTENTLESNISRSRLAWNIASKANDKENDTTKKENITVFGTGVDVTVLADEAAMRWVKVNLLQE